MFSKESLAILVSVIGFGLWLGCGGDSSTSKTDTPTKTSCDGTVETALVGNWRILTETKYYTNSLPPSTVTPPSTLVVLDADGGWTFGSSSGTWCVASIVASDWTTWAIADYGAKRKLILTNWNDTTEQGPIDEPTGAIDNLWIIYSDTGDSGPGTIWMKLGASG
ncbi:MAG: hypothetical protein HYS22_06755 [Deltaproteobacteria bacterium]|nr:hypothetical protein [Deltaproteobacteria bacterium]